MSTVREFVNAPVCATATSPYGHIAFKTGIRDFEWSVYDSYGWHRDNRRSAEMVGFTLNPTPPTTAQEALDLAWELAHEVREGRTIPEGTRYLELTGSGLREYVAQIDFEVVSWLIGAVRTFDPLPDPEPAWLDAPAVLAAMNDCSSQKVWLPKPDGRWECTCCGVVRHWSKMTDVTPLYPKEDAEPADIPDDPLRRRAYLFHYGKPWGTRIGGDPA